MDKKTKFLARSLVATLVAAVTAFSVPALADGSGSGSGSGVKKKRAKAGAKNGGGRERVLSREATLKGKDQTKVDFDAADIGGQRKMPMGDTISQNKSDKNYDFVKIRLRWHPEMVQSASALDSTDSK